MQPLEGAIHTSERRGNVKLQRFRNALPGLVAALFVALGTATALAHHHNVPAP